MKTIQYFVIALMVLAPNLCIASSSSASAEPSPIVILVPPSVLESARTFLQPDETPETFADFTRAGSYRDLTDYLLLRRALALGGNTLPIVAEPWFDVSYDRVVLRLRSGHASVFSNGIWREDFAPSDAQLKTSSPLFRYGEMEAGIYMNPQNPKLQSTKTLDDVQKLTAVSSKQWRPDWNALQQLGLAKLHDNVHWESMMKMVHTRRVDFMLSGFSSREDLSYQAMGITLLPVPGLKVKLAGSRGWIVSQTHPAGADAYRAIEKGLVILRDEGVITQAYRASGVINERVADWKVLNPDMGGFQRKNQ
ncbi:MAG: hypothetical protein AAGC78_16380 [Cellvibrio sp.]|uniref:hypothetical protein n=1 Tax=Cellvibrio sp. TaxID=1965322 RepID=UPI0031A2E3ED